MRAVSGEGVKVFLGRLRRAYKALDAEDRVQLDRFEGDTCGTARWRIHCWRRRRAMLSLAAGGCHGAIEVEKVQRQTGR